MSHIFSKKLKYVALAAVVAGMGIFSMGAAKDDAQPSIVIIEDGCVVPGVTVAGQDVGSLTQQQAIDIMNETYQNNIENYSFNLKCLEESVALTAEQMGIAPEADAIAAELMLIGRKGSAEERLAEREKAAKGETDLPLTITYDEAALNTALDEFLATINAEPTKEDVIFDPSLPERFQFTERKNGFQPDAEALKASVAEAITSESFGDIDVPGTVVEPDGTPSDVIENTQLISKFTTEYKGSSSNRIHNIKTASDNMNGTVVQPGEEFSTNDVFGPRTSAAIWKPAPAIENKVYKNQLGGGVCQASSTLCNAVLMADLEILEWKHHSWPSTYVKIGCDATINTGTIDFKWKNNTDWPIYVVSHADTAAKNITVEVWGRPLADGKSIEIHGERTGTTGIPGTPVYVTDPSEVSKGRIGQYSATYKIYRDKDGNEIERELIDKNYYAPVAPRVLKTAPAAAATQPPAVNAPAAEAPAAAPAATPAQPAATPPPAVQPPAEELTNLDVITVE